jgi:primosomal protein N' (replication factor Y)
VLILGKDGKRNYSSVKRSKCFYWIKTALPKRSLSLHGVTSSGKRDLHQVDRGYLITGKQVLYLLPEIALLLNWLGG